VWISSGMSSGAERVQTSMHPPGPLQEPSAPGLNCVRRVFEAWFTLLPLTVLETTTISLSAMIGSQAPNTARFAVSSQLCCLVAFASLAAQLAVVLDVSLHL